MHFLGRYLLLCRCVATDLTLLHTQAATPVLCSQNTTDAFLERNILVGRKGIRVLSQGIFIKDMKTVIVTQQLCDTEWTLQLLSLALYILRLKLHLISDCLLTKQFLYGTQISSCLKMNSNVQSLLHLKIHHTSSIFLLTTAAIPFALIFWQFKYAVKQCQQQYIFLERLFPLFSESR